MIDDIAKINVGPKLKIIATSFKDPFEIKVARYINPKDNILPKTPIKDSSAGLWSAIIIILIILKTNLKQKRPTSHNIISLILDPIELFMFKIFPQFKKGLIIKKSENKISEIMIMIYSDMSIAS